jgi:hypothetical protein
MHIIVRDKICMHMCVLNKTILGDARHQQQTLNRYLQGKTICTVTGQHQTMLAGDKKNKNLHTHK